MTEHKWETFACPKCGNEHGFVKVGSILSPRGRVQRFLCKQCGKRFHPSLKTQPIELRQCYLDIETSQLNASFGHMYSWALKPRGRAVVYSAIVRKRSLEEEKRIIKELLSKFTDYDEVVTYYGKRFDIPFLRTRALFHGLDFPEYMELYHLDLWFVARARMKLHSNRLDTVAKFLQVPDSKTPLDFNVWVKASFGDKKALQYILTHNIQDVKVLEQVHLKLEPYFKGTRSSI